MKILLEAPILTKSGYGEHSRLVYQSLKGTRDLEIFINPLNWGSCSWGTPPEDVLQCIRRFKQYSANCEREKQQQEYFIQIHVGIPNEFEKKAPYSVCVTAGIETDRVSAPWLFKTHQGINKLVVTSDHASDGFTKTGYEVFNKANNTKTSLTCACPIEVVNYPVKTPDGRGLDIEFETSFNFLQIAMMGPRKNIETSIKCFIEEFRDNPDVGFVLKTSLSKSSIIDRTKTKSHIQDYINSLGEKKCKIYLVHGNLSESEIHSLYMHPKIKAYYTTTHGEGFGLPIFEAVYSGIPVVATDWSGHLDFLSGTFNGKTKKLFAKIDYDLREVQESAVWGDLITKDSRWAFVREQSVKAQLSKMYKNYGMYKKWSSALKQQVLESHNKDKILSKMKDAILSVLPQQADIMSEQERQNNEVVVFD